MIKEKLENTEIEILNAAKEIFHENGVGLLKIRKREGEEFAAAIDGGFVKLQG